MQSSIRLKTDALQFEPASAWKRFGLIALATDLTSERDFARIMPPEQAGIYATRVAFENPTTADNLRQMGPLLTTAAELLLPGEILDAICYSCTAASVVMGDDAVCRSIQCVHPGVPVVTPAHAACLAFEALGIQRICVLTPYLVSTSEPMAAYFEAHGLRIMKFDCLGLEDDRVMARLSRETIFDAACEVDCAEAQAIFISCTALPSVPVIAALEARLGKPVVTSNQASAWAMINHARLSHRPTGFGRLFDFSLPNAPR